MRPIKILVVDDSELTLEVMRQELTLAGYEVVTRDHPIGSGVAIMREQPDLVLLDVIMPVLSGPDVVHLIRKNPALSFTKVLLCSYRSEEEMRLLTKSCGADGYICKGDNLRDVADQVTAWLTAAKTAAPPPPSTYLEETLLFVDNEIMLRNLRRIFSELPSTAYSSSGEDALLMLASPAPPGCVLVAALLDDMTGEQLYRRAIAIDPAWRRRFALSLDKGYAESDFLKGPDAPTILTRPLDLEAVRLFLASI